MMAFLETVLWVHLVLAGIYSAKTLIGIWYINDRYTHIRASKGDPVCQKNLEIGWPARVLAAVFTWGMISVFGFLGGYLPFLRTEKVRFFFVYSKEELTQRVDALVEMAEQREQPK